MPDRTRNGRKGRTCRRGGVCLSAGAKGLPALCGGRRCLIGNRRLLEENGVSLGDAEEDGKRLEGEGKTVLCFSSDGSIAALFAVADTIKEGSAEAVDGLKARGIRPVMLTGDAEAAARAVAKQAGIDEVIAEVLPEDKLKAVIESRKTAVTAMVGDGINDSPALKESDIGVAMGNGTDVAIDSADVVLVGGDLRALDSAVDLSRATVRNIKENLFWAFIYNVLCIPIAAGALYAVGWVLNPMIGALAMSVSSVFVVTNALRLMRFRPRHEIKAREGKGDTEMKKILMIEGMSCAHCSARVENALNSDRRRESDRRTQEKEGDRRDGGRRRCPRESAGRCRLYRERDQVSKRDARRRPFCRQEQQLFCEQHPKPLAFCASVPEEQSNASRASSAVSEQPFCPIRNRASNIRQTFLFKPEPPSRQNS